MKSKADGVANTLLLCSPADLSIDQLERKSEQLHGASLYAIFDGDLNGHTWLSYLSDTLIDMARAKRDQERLTMAS